MLIWVLQVLLKEMFQKAVSQNKDRMVLFPMPIFFRNTGRQGSGGKGFKSLCVCWNSLSMHLFRTWWFDWSSCAGMTLCAHGSHCFKNPMLCSQNPIICIPTEQRERPSACEAHFIPLVEVCRKAETGTLFCVFGDCQIS